MTQITWVHDLAVVAAASAVLALLSYASAITVAFGKIRQIEAAVGMPGREIDFWRHQGGDPIARFMRATSVFIFLACRRLPRHGARMAARLGDETKELTPSLERWGIIPIGAGLAFTLVFAVLGGIGMAFSD